MSRKVNSSLVKGSPSNTLFKYFAKSPVVAREKKLNGGAAAEHEKDTEKENEARIEINNKPPAKRKLSIDKIVLHDDDNEKEAQKNGNKKRHKVENKEGESSDDDEHLLVKSRNVKKRRIISSSDEEEDEEEDDQVEDAEYKPEKQIESSEDEEHHVEKRKAKSTKRKTKLNKQLEKEEEGTEDKKKKEIKVNNDNCAEDSGALFMEKLEECKRSAQQQQDGIEKLSKKLLNGVDVAEDAAAADAVKDQQNWPHLKLEFLQPDKIKDKQGRRPDHEDYDATTIHVPDKFLNSLTPAMRQWWTLKSQNFDCVLFFKVGKFYELFHMDADVGVKELGFTYMRGEHAHSGFPEISFDKMASILIDRGYKVARVEQTETVEKMTERCKATKTTKFDQVVRREICQISNRGTRIFMPQCQISPNHELNYMLAITEQENNGNSRFGIAFIDTTIGDFNLSEFNDDRNCSRLLTLLSHHMPVLVITERNNLSSRPQTVMRTMLSDALKEQLPPGGKIATSAEKTLRYLADKYYGIGGGVEHKQAWPKVLAELQADSDHLGLTPQENAKLALKALGLCIAYLERCKLASFVMPNARYIHYIPPDEQQQQQQNVKTKFANFMVLDSTTLSNLNIITLHNNTDNKRQHTLLSTLDNCCTKFGKRLLHYWLCAPSCELSVIHARQEVITALLADNEILQNMRALFNTLPDFERNLAQLQLFGNKFIALENHPESRAILFEEAIYNKKKIKAFINTIKSFDVIAKKLPELFKFDAMTNIPLLQRLTCLPKDGGAFPDLSQYLSFFQNAFDHEKAETKGVIEPKPGADADYDEIQVEIKNINDELNAYLKQQEKFFGCSLHYVGTDKKRYQIEVPEKHSHKAGKQYALEGQRKGFKRYTTDQTREFLRNMINAERCRTTILHDISRRIFEKFGAHYDIWKQCVECISILDVLGALAAYARAQNVICVPVLSEAIEAQQPVICIDEGYHPCIDIDDYIPNGIELGTSKKAPLAILTGANMGGKSTLMRQVGLLVVMAQIGAHVPAKNFSSTLVDRIFTRLGAEDDILAGQSTFLVEMNETSFILRHATINSLVLMDELGRGTGSYDGFAIATSVVNFLGDLKCRSIFSTHYHNLLDYFHADSRITLGHMACLVENEDSDNPTLENVTFLYKYADGSCPKSYGFHTAKLASTPTCIIERAYELAKTFKKMAIKRKMTEHVVKCALNGNVNMSEIRQLLLKVKI